MKVGEIMNLKDHVKRELDILLQYEQDQRKTRSVEELEKEVENFNGLTPQEYINQFIIKIIEPFYDLDLDESSIDYLFDVVYRLVKLQNLSPLTLSDKEFIKVADSEELYQNIRNCLVFKSKDRGIYHIDGPEYLDMACGRFKQNNTKQDNTKQDNTKQLSIYDLGVEEVNNG